MRLRNTGVGGIWGLLMNKLVLLIFVILLAGRTVNAWEVEVVTIELDNNASKLGAKIDGRSVRGDRILDEISNLSTGRKDRMSVHIVVSGNTTFNQLAAVRMWVGKCQIRECRCFIKSGPGGSRTEIRFEGK